VNGIMRCSFQSPVSSCNQLPGTSCDQFPVTTLQRLFTGHRLTIAASRQPGNWKPARALLAWPHRPMLQRQREQPVPFPQPDYVIRVVTALDPACEEGTAELSDFVPVQVPHGIAQPSGCGRRQRYEAVPRKGVKDLRVVLEGHEVSFELPVASFP
jgi:hypothetical protein